MDRCAFSPTDVAFFRNLFGCNAFEVARAVEHASWNLWEVVDTYWHTCLVGQDTVLFAFLTTKQTYAAAKIGVNVSHHYLLATPLSMADLDDDDIEYSVRACTFVILSLSFGW